MSEGNSQLAEEFEVVVHHEGRLIFGQYGPEYVGGTAVELTLISDYVSYFELIKMGTGNLGYTSVERIHYLAPGQNTVDGLHQICDDANAKKIWDGAKLGVGTIFLEGTRIADVVVDNEDVASDMVIGDSSGEGAENSVIGADVGVIHLVDDSDRTSDPEFYQAMENLGIANRRRRYRTRYDPSGVEVDFIFEEDRVQQAPEEINNDGGEPNEENIPNEVAGEDVAHEVEHSASDADDEGGDEEDPTFNVPTEDMDTSPKSSYRGSSQSDHASDYTVDGEEVNSLCLGAYYDPSCDHSTLQIQPGLRFRSPTQFKEEIVNYSIAVGAEIRWKRSNKLNKEAICMSSDCNWRVFASWFGRNVSVVVKAVGDPHSCSRTMRDRSVTAKWIAKTYLSRFRNYPDIDVLKLAQEIKETHELEVTPRVCANARAEAKKMLTGTVRESYAKLRPYLLQLKTSDPEGHFVVEVDPVAGEEYVLFRRIYIGFNCLKKGFLKGCRRMIGLDGCFFKGEVQGMLLSVVAKDGNNQMFPIAWAVVEGENRSSWSWFLEILRDELSLNDGTGWSLISDQQKGLVDALNELLPLAEHRKCARHVSANWKIKHKTDTGRSAFWSAVYACNLPEYNIHLAELKKLQDSGDDPDALNDFLKYDPKTFSRAFISRMPKSDSVESNICETWNGCIVKWRGLRIINMLEGIRTYVMSRLVAKVKLFETTKQTSLCPRVAEKIERGKRVSRHCNITRTIGLVCECSLNGFRYVVDLEKYTCTCGYWELSGIPCVHAISVASYLRKDIYYWAHEYFTLHYARKAYIGHGGIPALPGQQAWAPAEGLVIRPPLGRVMPGRPKKSRRKEAQELEVRPGKRGGSVMGKKGLIMHCTKCNLPGHNVRNCTATVPAPNPTQPPTRRVREESPEEGRRVPRTVTCGHCFRTGHNTRSCLIRKGIQTVDVTPNTTNTVRQQEERNALNGVGLYCSPRTGNAYFVPGQTRRGRRGARGRGRNRATQPVMDAHEAGPSQPPATQPSE